MCPGSEGRLISGRSRPSTDPKAGLCAATASITGDEVDAMAERGAVQRPVPHPTETIQGDDAGESRRDDCDVRERDDGGGVASQRGGRQTRASTHQGREWDWGSVMGYGGQLQACPTSGRR